MEKEELFTKIREAVGNYDEESAKELVEKALEKDIDAKTIITEALTPAIRKVGELFAQEKIFLTQLLLAADVFGMALDIVKPKLLEKEKKIETIGRVVIGTVAGDIHDLGKSLVYTMLMAWGFEVIDLGKDVPTEVFVQKVRELEPDILGMSALMTTTMLEQRKVIKALEDAGLRDKVKVMVGGAPVTREWAEEIIADGYAPDAFAVVKMAKKMIGGK